MRISNPTLFNGQTLATKQQISGGLITIPSASILGLSELAAAVSGNTTNISTISSALGTLNVASDTTAFGKILTLSTAIDSKADKTALTTVSSDLNTKITGVAAELAVVSGDLNTKITGGTAELAVVSGDLNTKIETVSGGLNTKITGVATELATVSSGLNTKIETVSGGLNTKIETVSGGLNTKITSVATELATVSSELKSADAYISGIVDAVSGYVYGNVDRVVKSGAYIPSSEQLQLSFTSGDDVLIPVSALVDEYSDGNGITISDSVSGKNEISIKINNNSDEKYLTVDKDGLATTGIDEAIIAAVSGKAEQPDLEYVSGVVSGNASDLEYVSGIVSINSSDLAYVSGVVSGKAEQSDLEYVSGVVSGKAEQSDLEYVSGVVSDTLDGITDTVTGYVQDVVAVKAEQSDLEYVSGQVSSNIQTIEEHATAIEGHTTAIGDLEQLSTFVDSKVLSDAVLSAYTYAQQVSGYAEDISGFIGELPADWVEQNSDNATVINYLTGAIDDVKDLIKDVETNAIGIEQGDNIYIHKKADDGAEGTIQVINGYDVIGDNDEGSGTTDDPAAFISVTTSEATSNENGKHVVKFAADKMLSYVAPRLSYTAAQINIVDLNADWSYNNDADNKLISYQITISGYVMNIFGTGAADYPELIYDTDAEKTTIHIEIPYATAQQSAKFDNASEFATKLKTMKALTAFESKQAVLTEKSVSE